MDTSSIASRSSDQPARPRDVPSAAPTREYRRRRQHLYPLEAFQAALASGGTVRSFCGIDQALLPGDPTDVDEVKEAKAEDCVTCVDIWCGREQVRL